MRAVDRVGAGAAPECAAPECAAPECAGPECADGAALWRCGGHREELAGAVDDQLHALGLPIDLHAAGCASHARTHASTRAREASALDAPA